MLSMIALKANDGSDLTLVDVEHLLGDIQFLTSSIETLLISPTKEVNYLSKMNDWQPSSMSYLRINEL